MHRIEHIEDVAMNLIWKLKFELKLAFFSEFSSFQHWWFVKIFFVLLTEFNSPHSPSLPLSLSFSCYSWNTSFNINNLFLNISSANFFQTLFLTVGIVNPKMIFEFLFRIAIYRCVYWILGLLLSKTSNNFIFYW